MLANQEMDHNAPSASELQYSQRDREPPLQHDNGEHASADKSSQHHQRKSKISDAQMHSQRAGTSKVEKHAGDKGERKKWTKSGSAIDPIRQQGVKDKSQTFGNLNLRNQKESENGQ